MIKASKTASKNLNFVFKMSANPSTKDAGDEVVIEGYANTKSKDRVGDVVIPSAFADSLPTYMTNPVLLSNHDWNEVCGVVLSANITDDGLFIRARISDTRPDIKTLVKEGCLRTFSIGYNELDADFDEGTQTKFVKKIELLEISVVSVPANTEALFKPVSAAPAAAPAEQPAKSAKALKSFIAECKSVLGESLNNETVIAICDYFNDNEVVMTKQELIALLNSKGAKIKADGEVAPSTSDPAGKPGDANKPAAESDKPADGDAMKELSAKMDAIAQALAQVLEKVNKLEADEAAEDKDESESSEDASSEEAPAADAADSEEDAGAKAAPACTKCGGGMKDDKEDASKVKCEKCGNKADKPAAAPKPAAGESDDEMEKQLSELSAQITALEDEINN